MTACALSKVTSAVSIPVITGAPFAAGMGRGARRATRGCGDIANAHKHISGIHGTGGGMGG